MYAQDTPHSNQNNIAHIGIIMDGNGRWANARLLDRTKGHLKGIQPVKDSLLIALKQNVACISFFVFSTENWKRPAKEVDFILKLLAGNLRQHYDFYREHDIKVVHSGNTEGLGNTIMTELHDVVKETKDNATITVNLAFNYGGKDDIIQAIVKYQEENPPGSPITEEIFETYLYHSELPPLDLVIRTGGQKRISNFFLWQMAYSEIYFSDVLWPDWSQSHMEDAIAFFKKQKRRFGGIG